MNRAKTVAEKRSLVAKGALWVLVCVGLLAFVVYARAQATHQDEPETPTARGPNIDTGCCRREVQTRKPVPGEKDWEQDPTSQDDYWTWWKGKYHKDGIPSPGSGLPDIPGIDTTKWVKHDNFTYKYNCSGYIFAGSAHWVATYGTERDYLNDKPGCWWLDFNDGTILISDAARHVCDTNWKGKVGTGPLQSHNNEIYTQGGFFPYKKVEKAP